MKLAIAQMVLGVVISFMGVKVFLLPLGFVFVFIGLAVLGCGIAQYLKAREARIKYEATP